jgi:hypothetical protein
MRNKFGWLGLVALTFIGAVAIWRQHDTQVRLRRQIGELRQQNHEVARQREENRRLVTSLPTAAELERLRADHAAIPRLRAEIEIMRGRAEAAENEASLPARFEAGSKVPVGDWKNAGAATSKATLETVLWAAASGDIDKFAINVFLPQGGVRERAMAQLESLPPAIREHYGTPERLVAFYAIRDVPLGAAQVVGWDDIQAGPSSGQVQVQLQLSAPDGQTKDLMLRFAHQDSGWKLVVPAMAVSKYAAMLKAPPGAQPVIELSTGVATGGKK